MTVLLVIRCKTCGNEDEVDIPIERPGMLVDDATLIAKAQIKECALCQRPLLGVTR